MLRPVKIVLEVAQNPEECLLPMRLQALKRLEQYGRLASAAV